MSALWDREKAARLLHESLDDGDLTVGELLDALEACVRPAPPQGIDHDALSVALHALEDDEGRVDGGAAFAAALALLPPVDVIEQHQAEQLTQGRIVDDISAAIALDEQPATPVEGVTLTPEEAAIAVKWYTGDLRDDDSAAEVALIARLEAAS